MSKIWHLKHRQLKHWLSRQKGKLDERWVLLQGQLLTNNWSERCTHLQSVPEGDLLDWQPQPGSSTAELVLLLQSLPLLERQLLACLLGAPAAGALTLSEAIERLELGWRQRLDPLHHHRQYAAQLESLARLLGIAPAARSAYLENEQKILPAIDQLLFAGLSPQLRSALASQHQPGSGASLDWWHTQLLARAGVMGSTADSLSSAKWPDLPPGWFALGWICRLRTASGAMGNYSSA